jgi:UPF0716 protein FxsA
MVFFPLSIIFIEILAFIFAVENLGFLRTLGFYFAPCLLGFLIISIVGRLSILQLQAAVLGGRDPGTQILHSGAIFLSGLFFLIPSFLSRVLGLVLLLPGFRHLLIWKFKKSFLKQISQSRFFRFGAGSASGGFGYYEFRPGAADLRPGHGDREMRDAEVLDVTPISISYEGKKGDKKDEDPST